MEYKKLFGENYKECSVCKRELPLDYPDELCPACGDRALFNLVKEYIRANNVNEHEVADHFQIPVSRVRSWIRDGRIEYRETEDVIQGMFCKRCGKPLLSGYFCNTCERILNGNAVHVSVHTGEGSRMRYVGNNKQEK